MLIDEWRKFKGWKVLEFFLDTGKEIHVKKLARVLNISSQTASYYLKFYKKAGVLKERKEANLLLYSLLDNALTRQLKVLYILDQIYPIVLRFAKKASVTSVVLYGSHASGTYSKESDIDLLVISQKKTLDLNDFKMLEKKVGKEVKVQIFSLGEWRSLKRKSDYFAQSVLSKHILLYGAEI
ncbi:hypothetical protein DRN75_02705 [Nanoarchaeota archaeon]|nr:MAG: hypothetical protein DRN75_02705 [Nanoarchaeota archaeon]